MIAMLTETLRGLPVPERIRAIRANLDGRIVFTTSFGLEDQVLTHMIVESGADIGFATLDTGRLFPETYALWQETEQNYGKRIAAFSPKHDAVERYVAQAGINGFYASVEARKTCCAIRKVEPLGRALAGAAGWITGLRADQSAARGQTPFAEVDAQYGLVKFSPLIDWSRDQALAYARQHDVPISPLHEKAYLSIGCAPCTRAVAPGETERAGRWWWEDESKKECGLHVGLDGRLTRATVSLEAVL